MRIAQKIGLGVGIALAATACGRGPGGAEGERAHGSEAWSRMGSGSDEGGGALTAGWTSSGGELASDAHNPWWIQNTETVRYCIAVDAATVSVDADAIDASLQLAIGYWKAQFDGDGPVKVVTQTFERVACNAGGEIALHIQAGEGTLDELQRAFLAGHLDKIVGIAVRTAYDRVNLRGAGFVYLRGDGDNYQQWRRRQQLTRVLVHELGHVFGLSHVDFSIMDERAPEFWFKDTTLEPALPELPMPFLRMPEVLTVDSWSTGYDFAKHQGDEIGQSRWAAYRISRTEDWKLRFEAADISNSGEAAPFELLGTLGVVSIGSANNVARFFLPPEQTVVTDPDPDHKFPIVTNIQAQTIDAMTFKSVEGWTKPVSFRFDRDGLEMLGVAEGRIQELFSGTSNQRYGQYPSASPRS